MIKKVGIITLVVILVVFGIIFAVNNFTDVNNNGQQVGGTGDIKEVDYPYIDIQTPEGLVRVQDYTTYALSVSPYEVVMAQEIGSYQISFFPDGNAFNIIILGHPLDKYQLEAEQKLLSLLKVSKENACKLNVKVGVTDSVDPRFSGQDFAMSFCDPIKP